jgi:hypothetical protein
MLAEVRPGSFIVTWFIPESIDEKLRTKVPRAIFKKYSVIELKIAGKCVYRVSKNQIPTKIASSSSDPSTATSEAATERYYTD